MQRFILLLTKSVTSKIPKNRQKSSKNPPKRGATSVMTNLSFLMSETNDGTVTALCHIYIIINK